MKRIDKGRNVERWGLWEYRTAGLSEGAEVIPGEGPGGLYQNPEGYYLLLPNMAAALGAIKALRAAANRGMATLNPQKSYIPVKVTISLKI